MKYALILRVIRGELPRHIFSFCLWLISIAREVTLSFCGGYPDAHLSALGRHCFPSPDRAARLSSVLSGVWWNRKWYDDDNGNNNDWHKSDTCLDASG
jgi:hypothetical protein